MDKAAILSEIFERNAVRKQAQMPLLDVRTEYRKACFLAREREWFAFIDSKQEDYDRLRAEVLVELRATRGPDFPNNSTSGYLVGKKTIERFKAFAELQYGVKPPRFNDPI